jgi:predicted nucleic acid-binding protein
VTLIVSDNSPLNLLVCLGVAEILPQLFMRVIIPTEVSREMQHPKAPQAARLFMANPPGWLEIRDPTKKLVIAGLDPGETAAISLALELRAALMIDEQAGRAAAELRGLKIVGAVGVLERAANEGLIADLQQLHARIRTMRFHVSDDVLKRSLERHLAFKNKARIDG